MMCNSVITQLIKLVNNDETDNVYKSFRIHFLIRYIRSLLLQNNVRLISPLEAGWAITDKCNSNCIHCWATGVNKKRDLPTELVHEIIDRLAHAKVLHVTLTGGEPFLRKDILEIIAHLKEHGIALTILTNGTMINRETIIELSKILDDDDIVQVSFDAPNDEIYVKQRGIDAFGRVVETVKLLKKYDIKVRLHFVATHINVKCLAETFLLANKLNVDVFSCTSVYPAGKGEEIYKKYGKEIEITYLYELIKIKSLKERYKIKLALDFTLPLLIFKMIYNYYNPNYNVPSTTKQPVFLVYENSSCSINVDGTVYPGNLLHFKEFELGNIVNEDLIQIWHSAYRKGILPITRDLRNTKCIKCKFFSLCKGGDPARTYKIHKSLNKPDPYCDVQV